MDTYTYAYLNAVLDENPSVTKLVLSVASYAVATGPVPPGEPDIVSRVTLEAQPDDAVPNLSEGFDAADMRVVGFFC
jgi:hypothetical protein